MAANNWQESCPFCGETQYLQVEDAIPMETDDDFVIICNNCGAWVPEKAWHQRPNENALNSTIAELEAQIDILKDQQREAKNILIDKNLQIDSLYEEGYKLQQCITELEAVVDKLIWSVEGRVEFMYSKHQREFEDIVAEYKEREE